MTACTPPIPPNTSDLTTPSDVGLSPSGKLCRDPGGQFTGREATAELGAEMLRVTGAATIRWVRPGMAVTMDFREDRLTVRLDERNRVISATCG